MKLYHYSKSRSTRVFWLLEELGLEYDAEMLPFDPRAFGLADHLEIESYGELPILVDAASSMSESIAVVTYLLDRY
ncbi:MAG: glutathione S-transferase, partial [Gammaproteobacteria bacterium]|nr:glutathione S-transferase [Gammaproteobacteria bacterium]